MRENEEAKFKKRDESTERRLESMMSEITEENAEDKYARLHQSFKRNVINKKISLVPKTGKGTFNVTVPQPFERMEAEKPVSLQTIKFQEMMSRKERIEQRECSTKIKARPIPQHVKINKYERLQASQERRREEAKRLAIAKTKAIEAPFEFYKRDVEALKKK